MPVEQGGMHKQLSPEARARRKIKNARNYARKTGTTVANGTTYHPACNTYSGCNHKKHSSPAGNQVR